MNVVCGKTRERPDLQKYFSLQPHIKTELNSWINKNVYITVCGWIFAWWWKCKFCNIPIYVLWNRILTL